MRVREIASNRLSAQEKCFTSYALLYISHLIALFQCFVHMLTKAKVSSIEWLQCRSGCQASEF